MNTNKPNLLRPALSLFFLISLVTGLVYPLAVTGVAQIAFPSQAAGSLIQVDGKLRGSSLIGQQFSDARYFWGRPSATSPMPYNGANSGGSNLGPVNPALADAIKQRVATLRAAHPGQSGAIPVDLVTTSASGLDPDISPAAAAYQAARVAKNRQLELAQVQRLIEQATTGPQWGVFGEARVNVLSLNLALDALSAKTSTKTTNATNAANTTNNVAH